MNTQGFSCDYGEDNSSSDELNCVSPTTTAPSSLPSSPEALPFSPLSHSDTLSQQSDSMSVDSETNTDDPFNVETCEAMQVETAKHFHAKWVGFKIIGDNIDKNVCPRHQSLEVHTKSLHYFHAFAALDRVNLSGLSEQRPSIDPSIFDLEKLLPLHDDICSLKSNFQIHVARIVTTYLPCLRPLKSVTPLHIKHKYYEDMSGKSVVVSKIWLVF